MTEIEIVTFDAKYSNAFAELNYAWIRTYFSIEEEDHRSLDSPYDYAIEPGGEIFFMLRSDQVIGTVALVPVNRKEADLTTFELAKMAIDPAFQGQGLGQKLLSHCIDWARSKGAQHIVLTTNDILKPALRVYQKAGFVEGPDNFDDRYRRGNLTMRLVL